METMSLIAGTPEWHAHRATHFNASDAPAMLGCSPFMTRAQLLHKLHTGLAQEHDAATERRFADGHRFEALARPLAEEIIGEGLAPVVGTLGELSASFDGLTLMGDVAFEHKTLSAELREVMEGEDESPRLPKHYRAQMEQQLMVSGAERVLFMASKWDGETLVEERHCWYASDPVLRAEIVAGWRQFAADLAAFKPADVIQAAVAAPIEALPAVSVQMKGALTVESNLDLFGAKLREFITRIPARPSSEQEFADCDAACKALKRAEEALDGAEANALGQVQSVEQITRMIGDLRTLARTARLASEKMVKARKEQIRTEEVQRGKDALTKHIVSLNASLGHAYMPLIPADFAGAVSGKKTVESLRNAIDTALARAKIAANEAAERVRANLKLIEAQPAHLFRDIATLVHKDGEAVQAIIAGRLAEEQRRQEAERERIRAEEAARLQREQEARDRETARQAAEAAKPTQPPAPVATAAPALSSNAANVVPLGTRAPNEQATLKLGEINARLGFTMTAEFVANSLGIAGTRERSAVMFRPSDFDRICSLLIAHIEKVRQPLAA
jgi:putative phage-type endonuclease